MEGASCSLLAELEEIEGRNGNRLIQVWLLAVRERAYHCRGYAHYFLQTTALNAGVKFLEYHTFQRLEGFTSRENIVPEALLTRR